MVPSRLALYSRCPLRVLPVTRAACLSCYHASSPRISRFSKKPYYDLPRLARDARPFSNTVEAASRSTTSSAFKVVLLSGFLGAGKTTVLEQLLRQQHGFKLGVIVNDLASVNVDANVLRDTIRDSGTRSVSLENGCVCCTAGEDLQESVQSLLLDAGSQELDAIVVELSGVAEPARVKQALEAPAQAFDLANPFTWKEYKPLSVRTVTVVDSPAFATDYLKEQSAHDEREHNPSGECNERYGTLLAEQVETADLLVLNKADVATDNELMNTQVMVKALNGTAAVRIAEYGKLEVDELLAIQSEARIDLQMPNSESLPASADATAEPVKSCCAAKTCSSTNTESTKVCESESKPKASKSRAETRFGISSFVYRTEHLMSRVKLMKVLGDWQKARERFGNKLNLSGLGHDSSQATMNVAQAGSKTTESPLGPILRSKGMLYLDVNPKTAWYWSHAGKAINFSVFGPWGENVPHIGNVTGDGARRTELVFIGAGYDEISIRNLLDSCLYTDDELRKFLPHLAP